MGEIIFLKLLPIIVSIAIVVCCLAETTQDIKKGKESRIEEIENWLTEVNEKEIAHRNPKPHERTSPSPVEEGAIKVKADDEGLDSKEHAKSKPEDEYTKWYVDITHQAAKLLNENKDILSTHNKTALRLLQLYSISGALYHSEVKQRQDLINTKDDMLKTFFGNIETESKTCPQRPQGYKLELKPQVCSVLKCIWESWHNEVGFGMQEKFEKVVELSNRAAKENGYNDAGEVWKISDVEDINAEKEMERLLDGVMPLYEQLHAYVRRKVFSYYSNDNSCGNQPGPDNPIPAHLTGNLIGQEWSEIESLVLPYPDASPPSFTKFMNSMKLDQNDMAHETEKFFTSLGFPPMTEIFWQKSTFNATSDSKLGCVNRVYDENDGFGYRMFMCPHLTLKDFVQFLRGMAHVVAFMESKDLPFKFRHVMNKIFSDGLGFIAALSVSAPDHLEKIFQLPKGDQNEEPGDENMTPTKAKERDINALMWSALNMLPMLTYSYVLEMWRYKVFSEKIPPEEYNRSWWEMRAKYQGIAPPSKRPDSTFDPGTIVQIAFNVPYGRYFFSLFVAFQVHEALCKISNHNGPLHYCDIYQSINAGKKLREVLKQGGSKPTVELLNELTGGKGYRFEPILKYYEPLHEWLKEQNKGHTVEWNKNFNME